MQAHILTAVAVDRPASLRRSGSLRVRTGTVLIDIAGIWFVPAAS